MHEKSFRHQEVPNSSIHHSVLVSLRVKVVKDRPIDLICGVAVAVAVADSKASHFCGRGGGLPKLSATQVVTIPKSEVSVSTILSLTVVSTTHLSSLPIRR